MLNRHDLHLIGYASGAGGPDPGSGNGPLVLQRSDYFALLNKYDLALHWDTILKPLPDKNQNKFILIQEQCQLLAEVVFNLVNEQKFFIVMGGDHTSAIGTWSGVKSAMDRDQSLGLIWIDAHLDSHTPETTPSGNIHGMPLACLLGLGDPLLTSIRVPYPKIRPEHLCIIGARSFEAEEEALLKKQNVRIFYMDEVKERGMAAVANDALKIVTTGTTYFGVSLDIDSIDPKEAPGTDVIVPDGLTAAETCQALALFSHNPSLIGAEIVEFDPARDQNQVTEKLMTHLTLALATGKQFKYS